MRSSLFRLAATALLFNTIPQLPAGVSAAIEPAIQGRAIAHIQPLEDTDDVAKRIHFSEVKRAIKHVQTPADANEIAQRITFGKRSEQSEEEKRAIAHIDPLENTDDVAARIHFKALEKRKGGGGGGKGGGGGGGGGKSSGGKTSSSGGKSKSSSSSSSSKKKSTGSSGGKSSSSGGKSSGNSKGYKTYGGKYGGGSSTGYRAGGRSPLGLAPFLLPLAAVALIFPGLWLYSVYSYHYNSLYQYYNETKQALQSVPVQCLCMQYSDCSCDDDGNTTYLGQLVGLNQSNTTTFANVDGVWTLLINGTVENGTGAADAGDSISAASGMNLIGYGWMVAVACYLAYSM
ncbi:hypothetical protein ABW20_dc0107929 [Dactylellina cionopaga]|nr:hypothetical protein ABW20_dc0107929 [Dactylellina cionopaga]